MKRRGPVLYPVRDAIRVLCTVLLASHPLSAQTPDSTTPLVLTVPLSVRSAGLNGAGAALVGHAGALFSNPAGIATVRHISLEGNYRSLQSDAYLAAAALAWRIRQFDLGLGIGYLNFGTGPERFPIPEVPVGAHTRDFTSHGTLVYRYGIIAAGGTVKYASRAVDSERDRALSFDGGLTIAIFDIMAIGFSTQNIGGNRRDESDLTMPRMTRLGFTMNYVDPLETFRLMSTLEFEWPEESESRFILGIEAGIVVSGVGLLGRGAYGSQPSEWETPEFSWGLSVAISRTALDYAYREADHLTEPVHMFGLRVTL
jgi:hypothetical protein